MRTIAILTSLVLSLPTTGWAAMLATGPVQATIFVCGVVNVGSRPVKSVTTEVVNAGTGAVIASETCSNLAPGLECLTVTPFGGPSIRGFCRIDASTSGKKLRGNLGYVNSNLGGTLLVLEAR